ncbi:hypothetical protein AALO_G00158470 [Alosa alosa]|uniref:Uncharacterized protein n=1 Tax=Alosa alosa TaxID=278164 RepID=A0AAV6GJ57_9TELE|nr:hypothetical protein AALO_G00158470 [Alosa alosa]
MEGLMFGTSPVGMPTCILRLSGCCTFILGIMMLVPMTTADAPAKDWPVMASSLPNQLPLAVQNHVPEPSPAALPASFTEASTQTAVRIPGHSSSIVAPLPPAKGLETDGSKPVPLKAFMPRWDSAPLHAPPPAAPESGEESVEGPLEAPARRPRELQQPSVPLSQIVPSSTAQVWSSSPSSASFIAVVIPDHNSTHVRPPMPPPVETQATNSTTSSIPSGTQGLEVLPAAITTAKPPVEPSGSIEDPRDHQLSPSFNLNIQNDDGTLEENLSHVLMGNHKGMTTSVVPTMGPMEDFYPTNTMEADWGSGDYQETMSFLGSEGDDYSLVSSLPSDMYDFEDSNSEAYDTSFPTRAALVPSGTLLTRYPKESSVLPELHVTRSPVLTSPVQPVMHMTRTPSFTNPDQYDAHVTNSPSSRATSVLPGSPGPTLLYSRPNITSPPSQTTTVSSINMTALPTFPPGFAEPFTNSSNVNISNPPLIRPTVFMPPPGSSTKSPVSPQDSVSSLVPDWSDGVTIEPTDLLLPDMNSLEYFTIQQTKEPSRLPEQRPNHTSPSSGNSITPMPILTTGVFTVNPTQLFTASFGEELLPAHNSSWPEESSTDTSGFEPPSFPTSEPDQTSQQNTTFLDPSMVLTPSMEPSVPSTEWSQGGGSDWMSTPSILTAQVNTTSLHTPVLPSTTHGQWDITPTVLETLTNGTSLFPPSISPSATVGVTPESSQSDSNATTFPFAPTHPAPNATTIPLTPRPFTPNGTSLTDMADEAITMGTPSDTTATEDTLTTINTNTASLNMTIPTAVTTVLTTVPDIPTKPPAATTSKPPQTTTVREYLCNITDPENYLVKVGFSAGSTVGYAKAKVREILKPEFNQSLELQVLKAPPDFVFRVVSGPIVYTAISVVNALRQSPRATRSILYVSGVSPTPGPQYHLHTVLQFVPSHIDVRMCTFSEKIKKGLTAAYAEVRRRSQESTNFTVQIVNITVNGLPKATRQPRAPVDVVFSVRDGRGYLEGADVSAHLRILNMVEFSYYLGLPVLQIAEPFHYPELNMTQLLRSSWVRTVLLGVLEPRVTDRTFQAKMERCLAQILGEALGIRRFKRATSIGNNSVQIVRMTRLSGPDSPLEMIYFAEGANGERLPAVTTATTLNRLDVQRAAIVLGYRVQGILAQPVEKVDGFPGQPVEPPTSTWVVIGVVIPVLVVVLITSILYWKFCRTDKLEFQPDTMVTGPQRQKLQAPSVKGFDFAKLHLGQPSKDDLRVIQEPTGPPSASASASVVKDTSTSESGEPGGFSSAKSASRVGRKKGRISPSDGDSVGSDRSSEKDSPAGRLRGSSAPHDPRQPRKMVANGLNGPPPMSGPDDQLSSASIFEHVDRMSRAAEGTKRLANKIQLIAMQPMPALPTHSPTVVDRATENAKINKEIQVALRHKSEIEHHRNKIRLRAKRKGHYDFPAMDDLTDGAGDPKEQDRIYQKAQQQIDKILDPDTHLPPPFTEPKKSGRGRRSPKSKKKTGHLNGEADRDQLITAETDGTYRKYPGVNNFAYVSDHDQAPDPIEGRQQMHSLLDNAFALVSPTAAATTAGVATAGITLPGVGNGHAQPPASSPPSRGPPRPWAPSYPTPGPISGRYGGDIGLPPPSVQSVLQRQGLGSGYLPSTGEGVSGEQPAIDSFTSRGGYSEELSSARPRPVGSTAGGQLHHLSQVGLPTRLSVMPPSGRLGALQAGGYSWSAYDDEFSKPGNLRDAAHRMGVREPSAPPAHLDTPGLGYPSTTGALQGEGLPSTHSSASLIKAIREELMRLSQKQASLPSFHS